MTKKFALIGAAGYIAPRHMKAIRDTGNQLLSAFDPSDSVGIMDSYFPDCHFFTEFERFDRHIEKLKYDDNISIDYVSICSPNYLHDAHMRFALRSGADAICEKPLVLNPWNLDKLKNVEQNTGNRIFNVLQLRVHPSIITLKNKIDNEKIGSKYEVDLTYLTTRGNWYNTSWKGDESKSGGIATNIGVHFYDMLFWLFGKVENNLVFKKDKNTASGFLELEKAKVKWFLSTEKEFLPKSVMEKNETTFRSIKINQEEIEFSNGFKDLHTLVYQDILEGKGFGIDEARTAIEIVHEIRTKNLTNNKELFHQLLRNSNTIF